MISDFPPQCRSGALGGLKHTDFAASTEIVSSSAFSSFRSNCWIAAGIYDGIWHSRLAHRKRMLGICCLFWVLSNITDTSKRKR